MLKKQPPLVLELVLESVLELVLELVLESVLGPEAMPMQREQAAMPKGFYSPWQLVELYP